MKLETRKCELIYSDRKQSRVTWEQQWTERDGRKDYEGQEEIIGEDGNDLDDGFTGVHMSEIIELCNLQRSVCHALALYLIQLFT